MFPSLCCVAERWNGEDFSHSRKKFVISVSLSPSCEVRCGGIHHNKSFTGGRCVFQSLTANLQQTLYNSVLVLLRSGCCTNPDEK